MEEGSGKGVRECGRIGGREEASGRREEESVAEYGGNGGRRKAGGGIRVLWTGIPARWAVASMLSFDIPLQKSGKGRARATEVATEQVPKFLREWTIAGTGHLVPQVFSKGVPCCGR
jgi:hypothetical protein